MYNKNYKNLIIDTSEHVERLTESTKEGKKYYIEGIFAQAEVVNGNKRVYPQSVLEKTIDQYIRESVSTNNAMGENDHPDYPEVDWKKASIKIEELKWDGSNVYGKALVLDNVYGQQIKSMLDAGIPLGVSTRCLGTVTESNGVNIVDDGLTMQAIDTVRNPSGPNCQINKLVESKQWYLNESTGMWIPKQEKYVTEKQKELNEELFLENLEKMFKNFTY